MLLIMFVLDKKECDFHTLFSPYFNLIVTKQIPLEIMKDYGCG